MYGINTVCNCTYFVQFFPQSTRGLIQDDADVLWGIATDIQSAKWYAIIVDETTDIGVKEQVSLCVRYVNEHFAVYEDFVGFYETGSTDSASIAAIITDVLCCLSLPVGHCLT